MCPEPGVDRQRRGDLPAETGHAPLAVHRLQFLEQPHAVVDEPCVGGIQEGKALRITEAERRHPQDHTGQVGAQDLGWRERLARGEILLRIETDADPLGLAAATSLALIGAGLGDRSTCRRCTLPRTL